ncbi:unnamed protein product, partial [Polarella glacialis]
VPRDDGKRSHQERQGARLKGRPGLRPDERASRSPRPGGSDRPHGGGVLPGRGRPGRAVVRGQHLPLYPGWLRGVCPLGPHSQRCWLPAHPGHGLGLSAG